MDGYSCYFGCFVVLLVLPLCCLRRGFSFVVCLFDGLALIS